MLGLGRSRRRLLPLAVFALAVLAPPADALAGPKLYLANAVSDDVAAFEIGSTGFLASLPGSPFAAGRSPTAIAMSPDGRRAYVTTAASEDPGVLPFDVAPQGALLPPIGSYFLGGSPRGAGVTPDGRFLYIGNGGGENVSAFEIHPGGAITAVPGSPFAAGGSASGIAISPDGRFVYAPVSQGKVSALAIGPDGALSPVAGSPFAVGGLQVRGATVTPDGRFLYVLSQTTGSVVGFEIAADGSLAPLPGFPVAAGGTGPTATVMAPDGRHLYVLSEDAGVVGFAISPAGSLAPVPGATFTAPVTGFSSGAITADGSLLFAAVPEQGSPGFNNVFGFAVAADGSLAQAPGSPYLIQGSRPAAAVVSPNQGPRAAFSASRAGERAFAFDGAASSDPDGVVARYDWDFGDGTSVADGGVAPSHTYAGPGTYRVALTVTDAEGCSTAVVYTGQTASCNGSAAAKFSGAVTVAGAAAGPPGSPPRQSATAPKLILSGAKTQKLGRWIVVRGATDVPASLLASGRLRVKTPQRRSTAKATKRRARSFRLVKAAASTGSGRAVALKLKVPKRARAAAAAALRAGGRASAKVTVVASGPGGPGIPAKRSVRLRR